MKFMKNFSQKKLAKTVVCGLLVSGSMFVGMGQAYADIKIDGSTMNVTGTTNPYKSTTFNGIDRINFYIDKDMKSGAIMLAGPFMEIANLFGVKNINAGVQNGSQLKVGDKIELINGIMIGADVPKYDVLGESDFKEYGLKFVKVYLPFEEDDDISRGSKVISLQAEVTSLPNENLTPEAKSPIETQAAGLTMLTTGADMLASQGFDNAAYAIASEVSAGGSVSSMTPFMVVGGNKTRVNSGSHVDVKGWNLNVGMAKEIDNKAGKLLIGPVVEYGKGSYESYLDNGFRGEGDSHYIGGGIMAKQKNDDGFYYEGSLRIGKLYNEYKSKGISYNSYDSDSIYYAAHVGVGKILKLSDSNTLDYYGKYFYTHQNGDNTNLHAGSMNYKLHLDSVNSNRTRIGGRFTHTLTDKSSIYAGLAWQHEFSGTARARIDSQGTPAPSVKGNTGIMELGWKVKAGKKLDLDLNATGYTGKQKGASLNLAVNYKF